MLFQNKLQVIPRLLRHEGVQVAGLLILATAIRLPLMPFPGFWHDLASYVNWGNTLVTHGFSNLYAVRATGSGAPGDKVLNAINYPPGTPYLFGALILLYNHTLLLVTGKPLLELVGQNGLGPFVAKLLLLAADLATATLLYREARKRHSQRFALLAAASFAFSPAVLYDGVIWGQTDGLVALPILLTIFSIMSERYMLAGVCIALAVLIKPQPAILIPLILLYVWRWARREDFIRCIAALIGVTLLGLLPVMVPHFELLSMLHNMQVMSFNDTFFMSQDAFNFWWLLGNSWTVSSPLLGVKASLVGDALFGIVTLISGVQIWRHREPVYFCFGLAIQVFGFFMFTGGQHERYLFLFIPLVLAGLIVSDWRLSDRLVMLYATATVLSFLNMLATVNYHLHGRGPAIPLLPTQPLFPLLFASFIPLSVLLAAFHLATFAYAVYVYLAERFAPLPSLAAVSGSDGAPATVSLSGVR